MPADLHLEQARPYHLGAVHSQFEKHPSEIVLGAHILVVAGLGALRQILLLLLA